MQFHLTGNPTCSGAISYCHHLFSSNSLDHVVVTSNDMMIGLHLLIDISSAPDPTACKRSCSAHGHHQSTRILSPRSYIPKARPLSRPLVTTSVLKSSSQGTTLVQYQPHSHWAPPAYLQPPDVHFPKIASLSATVISHSRGHPARKRAFRPLPVLWSS